MAKKTKSKKTKTNASETEPNPTPLLDAPPPQSSAPTHRLHIWQFQAVRDIFIITAIILTFFVGYWLRSVTTPLLLALTLAYLCEPLVVYFCKKRELKRPTVVAGIIAFVGIPAAILTAAVTVLLVMQTLNFVTALPDTAANALHKASEVDQKYRKPVEDAFKITFAEMEEVIRPTGTPQEEGAAQNPDGDSQDENQPQQSEPDKTADQGASTEPSPLVTWLRTNMSSILKATVQTTGEAVSILTSVVGSVIYLVFLAFLVPFYFFYFSTSWPNIRRFVRENLPPENFKREYVLVGKMDAAIAGFVRGRIVISIIMGVMLALGWAFCGVPYWLVLGLFTGALCAVPYLGGLGLPVAVILTFLAQDKLPAATQMAWWATILWPSLVFGIVQTFEGYVLTPYIAGKATDLGPVSILVAVLAGGAVMGVYGMLIAIPAMACVKILFTEVFLPRVQQWSSGDAEDILPIEET